MEHLEIRHFLLEKIEEEIKTLKLDPQYWDSIEQIGISNAIFGIAKSLKYINQDWLDNRLKFSEEELFEDLRKNIISLNTYKK